MTGTDPIAVEIERHSDLSVRFQAVTAQLDDIALDFGGSVDGWTDIASLLDPADATVTGWLQEEAEQADTTDIKTQAALLLGRFTSHVAKPLAALYLMQGIVPDLDAATLSIRVQHCPLPSSGQAKNAAQFVLRLPAGAGLEGDPSAGGDADAQRDRLRRLLTDILGRMVERLRHESGLSRGALWRVAGDSLAYLFLNLGRRIGAERRAMDEAMLLLKAQECPMNNRKLGYVLITPPDGVAGPAQWFITRGGCCRYYECVGGEVCIVCVLRPPAERDAMLRDILAGRQAA